MHKLSLSLFLFVAAASGCAGARGSLAFDRLSYPVSSSSFLYGPDEQLVAAGQLTTLTSFTLEKRIWGILWSFVPLSGAEDVSDEINERIAEAGGEGVTNLSVQVENCGMNYVPIINWLPIYPGCTLVHVTGVVVKLAEPTLSPPKARPLAAAEVRSQVRRALAKASPSAPHPAHIE